MKTKIIYFSIVIVIFFSNTLLSSYERYVDKYNTIAHELLRIEAEVNKYVTKGHFELLDKIIDELNGKIKYDPANPDMEFQKKQATDNLEQIEQALVKNNFVWYDFSNRSDDRYTICDGLTSVFLSSLPRGRILLNKPFRRTYYEEHSGDKFCHFDCDISSFIFLGIAEHFGLPLYMVEIPGHNFVRWKIDENNFINWDTNNGGALYTNEDYWRRWYNAGIIRDYHNKSIYLSNLSIDEVKGYYYFLLGLYCEKIMEPGKAAECYNKSIDLFPKSPLSKNNIAWLYVTNASILNEETRKLAVMYSGQAVDIEKDPNMMDTKACAYAEIGDFPEAIKIEEEVVRLTEGEDNEGYKKRLKGFKEGKTYLQQQSN